MRRATLNEQMAIHKILLAECKKDEAAGTYKYPDGVTDDVVARRVAPDLPGAAVKHVRNEMGIPLRNKYTSRKAPEVSPDIKKQVDDLTRDNGVLRKELTALARRVEILEGKPSLRLAN